MGHDIAWPRGEVQQYFDGLWPHMSGLTSVGYLPFERLDQYIAQVEALYQLGLQLFFTFVPGRPNDSSQGNFSPNIINLRSRHAIRETPADRDIEPDEPRVALISLDNGVYKAVRWRHCLGDRVRD
jgi:hypothetical protein